ncbi:MULTISPECIES: diguanylate cyclase [Dehalobacter]|jgi:diguanylate cyclase (GGDEF)-like protein/PAS domain S-box-containing protein|nr:MULTISPECIES: diguanylate cyclase [unclassified Dehalobacter]MCG1026252.1 diguanylate cyclase [Dehalobacter sp.]MDJ0306597.1 diguanylate cyclase [Dehalobacter sp.]OCZ53299.1 diguanylate cyclase [Dehalobacter sp. TeCB1]
MMAMSYISMIVAYTFVLFGLYILKLNHKETLNRLSASLNFCFAYWSFIYSFLYLAPSPESALFWHRIAAIGWVMFCPLATHFFLVLSEKTKNIHGIHWYIPLYGLPTILLLKTLLTNESLVAKVFVQSTSGLGWTYELNTGSVWFWLYWLMLVVYIGVSLFFTLRWGKNSQRPRFIKQAKSISILAGVMMLIGIGTDFILPLITPFIPPLFHFFSIFWGFGGIFMIRRYKLMDVNIAVTPDIILETVMDPIVLLDNKGIIRKCNQATFDLLKYDASEMLGRRFSDFFKAQKYNLQRTDFLFKNKFLRNIEFDMVDSTGKVISIIASFSVAETELDGIVGVVGNLHDITGYKAMSKELEKMANYDKLTNLPNRRMFYNKLEKAIEKYHKHDQQFALVFIDLDGFKVINDTFGHDIGDQMLMKVSSLLAGVVRRQDVIARLGGDEFVLLFSRLQDMTELDGIMQRMQEKLVKPIMINNKICRVGMSFGISICPEDGMTPDELLKTADLRMYREKKYSS